MGAASLAVFRRPKVGVLTTGNELVMPGEPLPPGAIYNSNRHTLRGLVQATGAQACDLGVVPDDLAATRAAANPDRIVLIRADQPLEQVRADALAALAQLLERKGHA